MARSVHLLLFLLTTSALGTGVVWDRTYDLGTNYTDFFCVQEVSTGGFVICARISYLDSHSNAALIKVDDSGNIQWITEYGDSLHHKAIWVEETSGGSFILTGWTTPGTRGTDLLLLSIAANGDTLWSRSYGVPVEGEQGYCIKPLSGGYAVCGVRTIAGMENMWVLRTDENGDTLWTRTILEGCDATYGTSLAIDFDGNIVAAGYGALSTTTRPVLAKLSPDGELIWFRRYTDPFPYGLAIAHSVVALSTGDCCFSTDCASLFRIASNGDTLWVQEYTFPDDINIFCSMNKTMDGGFVCSGYVGSPPYVLYSGWIVKTTSTGDLEWQDTYGSIFTDDKFSCVSETSDGGYICAGSSDSDGWLVRLEPEVGIEEPAPSLVTSLSVSPNPFTSTLNIGYNLPEPGQVDLSVYDLTGRLVENLESSSIPAGEHTSIWSPEPNIPDGCYLVVLDACGEHLVGRCVKLD